jgi:endogenous inhibitor of DNA gyrase (YacG/DUF329 family)
MANTLRRSVPCLECGAEMMWTQNAWNAHGERRAAYRCLNGHTLNPALTRQCPTCGEHDTVVTDGSQGEQELRCLRCGQNFAFPR